MRSEDQFSDAELRSKMGEVSTDLRESADADAEALKTADDSSQADLNAAGYQEVVANEPALAGAVSAENYEGLGDRSLDQGESNFERAFNEARRSAMTALATDIDQAVSLALQSMVDTLDAVREVTDTVGTEAGNLATSAASGLLKPVTQEEIDDFTAELEDARDQGRLASRETANLVARRQASRVADGSEQAPDNMPVARSIPNRPIVRTTNASERGDRDDQGFTLAAGRHGQTRSAIAVEVIAKFQVGTKDPLLKRPHLNALCAAIGNLERLRKAHSDAKKLIKKMRRIHVSLSDMVSTDFMSGFRENMEKQAANSITSALSVVEDVIDTAEQFAKAVASPLSMFVSTVDTVGTVPDTQPSTQGMSSICGLKAEKLCKLLGLVEVSQSLDVDLGLTITVPNVRGRVRMLLDTPPDDIVPHHLVVPGQEADLILVSVSGTQVVARFSRQTAPTHYDNAQQAFIERPNVFGTGPGKLVLLGNGTQEDVEFTYTAVSYSPVTNNYTFTLTLAPGARVPTVRGQSDPTALGGLTGPAPGANPTTPVNSWNATILFPVNSSAITMRVPEAQASDIVIPCDLALGVGEQTVINGEYDATVANTVRALSGAPFASWMVGLPIDLGPATATAQAARRTIATFVNATTITYAGTHVPGHLSGGTRGAFRFTADSFEVRRATSMVAGPHPDLKSFTLNANTSRPHTRMLGVPQTAVRIAPDVRDDNLTAATTPADGDVRDLAIWPQGITVFTATYEDTTQDALFTPIILGLGAGNVYIAGQGPFPYTAVADEAGPSLRFTLAGGTPQAFAEATVVEVETQSILDVFAVEFPPSWLDPFDDWARQLEAEINKLEAKLCRLMSGKSQDLALSAYQLSVLASLLSLTITTSRAMFMAWIVPIVQSASLTRALEGLGDIGATRAETALREGRIGEFAAMEPAEGNNEGSTLIVTQEYQNRVTTDEQYRVLSKSVAEVRARFDALVAATNAVGDIKTAQQAEMDRKRAGARRIEALQEKLP